MQVPTYKNAGYYNSHLWVVNNIICQQFIKYRLLKIGFYTNIILLYLYFERLNFDIKT